MRIERLDLSAYGPFTGRSLDLSRPGVHLIIGPNEAGKSTTLAAIGDALFGIPHQPAAAFLHEARDLKLGMSLRRADGATLTFERLKKRVDSLRRADGSVISEDEFRQFLGAIDRDLFSSMYGIDHARLVAGGADLLAGKGELGQAILGAGVGAVNLPAALKELTERANSLFTPKAQKPKLNSAISRYDELIKVANDFSLRPTEFAETSEEIERLSFEKTGANERKETITAERDECVTLLNLFDRIGQRRIATDQLSDLAPEARRLREGMGAELETLTTELSGLRAAERKSAGQLESLDTQIAGLSLDPTVLEQKDVIQRLGEERAKYRSDSQALPGARQTLETTSRAARDGLLRLGIEAESTEDLGSARAAVTVSAAAEARVAGCAERESEARAEERSARGLVLGTRSDLEAAKEKLDALPELPDDRQLTASVRSMQTQEDLTARHDGVAAALRAAEADLAVATSRLGLGSVSPAEFLALRVPTRAALNELRQAHDGLVNEGRTLRDQVQDADALRAKLTLQLDELLAGGDIPSLDDLRSARSGRDAIWAHVRASWLGSGEPTPDGGEATPEGSEPAAMAADYEAAVTQSDRVVDRLRDEADAVATRVSLETQLADLEARTAITFSELETCDGQLAEFDQAWQSIWSSLGIRPGNPTAMSEWLDDYNTTSQVASAAVQLQSDLADVSQRVESQRFDLIEALRSVGIDAPVESTLATLAQRSTAALDEINDEQESRTGALTAIGRLEEQLQAQVSRQDERVAELAAWEQDWVKVRTDLGLADLSPAEANSHLVEASKVLANLDRIEETRSQISVLEASISEYEALVHEVAVSLGASGGASGSGDPHSIVAGLTDRLTAADTCRIKHEQLLEARSDVADQLVAERADLKSAEDRLDGLFGEAGVGSEVDLRSAIEHSDRLRTIESTIERLTHELSAESGGRTADELEQILAGRDKSKLQLAVDERSAELAEIDAELAELNSHLGALNADLKRWDGSSKAADASNEAQLVFSEIGSLTEEYLAAQMAVELLREHISSFREKNQGAILNRAAPWFDQMTGGSFHRLEANYDSGESVVLEAIRPNGRALTVDQMSEGTRDQLYLALRLAALAESVSEGEPYPVVLDDLLMTFDDVRAEATLRVLGELSESTQVLLFTHHQHLREIAEGALGPALTSHEL